MCTVNVVNRAYHWLAAPMFKVTTVLASACNGSMVNYLGGNVPVKRFFKLFKGYLVSALQLLYDSLFFLSFFNLEKSMYSFHVLILSRTDSFYVDNGNYFL